MKFVKTNFVLPLSEENELMDFVLIIAIDVSIGQKSAGSLNEQLQGEIQYGITFAEHMVWMKGSMLDLSIGIQPFYHTYNTMPYVLPY
ncbi:11089_t:CDS:2 [Entrophospora sp. SA101]|nr:11089_t:CDS:2 [Entrophospora sp. SA101]